MENHLNTIINTVWQTVGLIFRNVNLYSFNTIYVNSTKTTNCGVNY